MPLQNRVLPTQEIVAEPGRGLLTGNRGALHGTDRRLGTTRWRSKAWICCVLDWKGVRRDPMPPGRWTALFFFDEAVALAAGHRPCAYCRRPDFLRYAAAWMRGSATGEDSAATADGGSGGAPRPGRPPAAELDARLHLERVDPRTRAQRTTVSAFGELPDGAMIRRHGRPALVLGGRALDWSWSGYAEPRQGPADRPVEVLTPPANLFVLKAGYVPLLHPSAVRN